MPKCIKREEVTVWVRDNVIRALRFKASSMGDPEQKAYLDLADKVKRGDILIIHNPDRRKKDSGQDKESV